MKQHLALEHPYSRTENGVKLHILCVLIAYLLLRRAHQEAGRDTEPASVPGKAVSIVV